MITDIWERLNSKDNCFIIAEAGSNHNGDLNTAKKLIDIAKEAGADSVKFQFFSAEKIAADTSHDIALLDSGKTLYQFYKEYETPRSWLPDLMKYSEERDITFLATPFDYEAVELLYNNGIELFKIASFELVDIPLLKATAKTNKPIILSTGMADLEDIQDALDAIYSENNTKVVLLHCGINYPLMYADVNLRAMETINKRFSVPVGYSDHTRGISVPIAAVALGAKVIEKHFTISRLLPGPDHAFALEPDELKAMVIGIRECEKSLGSLEKKRTSSEEIHFLRGRRSLFAATDINEGDKLEFSHFIVLRPGVGLKPKLIYDMVGKIAKKSFKKNEPISSGIV